MASNLSRPRIQFWEEHIAQRKATELSQVEYCRRNKISLNSFQYWKGKAKLKFNSMKIILFQFQ